MRIHLLALILLTSWAGAAEESFQSPHTLPYPADEAGSIGVAVKAETGALRIIKILPGSPAEKAKLKENDLIIQADGNSFKTLTPEQKIDLLRGKKGTKVNLVISRDELKSTFTISLDRVPLTQFLKPKEN